MVITSNMTVFKPLPLLVLLLFLIFPQSVICLSISVTSTSVVVLLGCLHESGFFLLLPPCRFNTSCLMYPLSFHRTCLNHLNTLSLTYLRRSCPSDVSLLVTGLTGHISISSTLSPPVLTAVSSNRMLQ